MITGFHDFVAWLPTGLPAYLFLITVVVFVHEMGHFLVARACGVAVEVFSIGFGGEIFGWNDRHGTRWRVSWIPFGGYVKFLGDLGVASTPDVSRLGGLSDMERSHAFPFRPLWQRAAVVAAGPFANFVLAIAIFTVTFLIYGQNLNAPVVDSVVPGSAAASAGIHKGDLIQKVDGSPVRDFMDLKQAVTMSAGQPMAIALERDGRMMTVHVTPKIMEMKDPFGGIDRSYALGITNRIEASRLTHVSYGPVEAFGAACGQTWMIVKGTMVYVWQMIAGYADTSQLRGPLGMATVSQKVAEISFGALVSLIALLSVSIGLINLFPIPLLDGGHLLYYAFEAVLGRPLGARVQDVGFRVGLAMVLGLMLLVTWNDLVRLNLF
ncbi:MAG: RIP metalloprotease RseP [Alphaproteobacteria bacterium]|nr:RIP metalloprotease RseP [Alphaproteobacteria bacterium]